jgi:hypothetical protein
LSIKTYFRKKITRVLLKMLLGLRRSSFTS